MKNLSLIAVLGLAVAIAGCKKEEAADTKQETAKAETTKKAEKTVAKKVETKDPHADLGAVTPDELEKLLAEQKAHCFDANGAETRKKFGTVPGATLLTKSDYDLGVLPESKDAKLVFYCSNEQCGAAPSAAKRAVAAGYSDVHTMPMGIMGWQKAGKKTTAMN